MRPEEEADNKPVIIGVMNPAVVMVKGLMEFSAILKERSLFQILL